MLRFFLHPNYKSQNHQNYLMNGSTKMCKKMEAVSEETKDDTMEDETTYSSCTTHMRTSTNLAAKLKKIKQMESITKVTIKEAIEIEANNAQKRACMMTLHASATTNTGTNHDNHK